MTMPETVGLWGILFICLKKEIRILAPKSKGLCPYLKRLPWCLRILRELFADVTKIWKLKYLSEKVNCSTYGQVSKLMKVLVENAWVETAGWL